MEHPYFTPSNRLGKWKNGSHDYFRVGNKKPVIEIVIFYLEQTISNFLTRLILSGVYVQV